MTQPTPAHVPTRVCGDCDGFPVVAIDTGLLTDDGTRLTLPVVCSGCDGAGAVPLPARSAASSSVGR